MFFVGWVIFGVVCVAFGGCRIGFGSGCASSCNGSVALGGCASSGSGCVSFDGCYWLSVVGLVTFVGCLVAFGAAASPSSASYFMID